MWRDLQHRLGLTNDHSGVYTDRWIAEPQGNEILSINPATGETLGHVRGASVTDFEQCVAAAEAAFYQWRLVPAPRRGDFVRCFGEMLRQHKEDLGHLITYEAGKIRSEGLGEIQEMIDMCQFAAGLSRQLYGLTIASERPAHSMLEQWHPLGPVGIITAFNFPAAVWAWNAVLAAVCGNSCIWKPSPLTPLTAIAIQRLAERVLKEMGLPPIFQLCIGDNSIGQQLASSPRIPLVSATGSCQMGRHVASVVGARLGRSLLELGGNNSAILTPSANMELALRAVVFAAVGTAGQRCTTLRRLIVHESVADSFLQRLVQVYRHLPIGDPWEQQTLVGPLIRESAVTKMEMALQAAQQQGGEILVGGKRLSCSGYFVEPTIVLATHDMPIVKEETFAPILYVMKYGDLNDALTWHNSVEQGLSSAIFTEQFSEAMQFLAVTGSDCGLANVNLGTSGAEIGGAFGGEKATGGGREAGADAWRNYMRRQTCTLNFSNKLPLAQGVKFDI